LRLQRRVHLRRDPSSQLENRAGLSLSGALRACFRSSANGIDPELTRSSQSE
jgi:hypothetical protein